MEPRLLMGDTAQCTATLPICIPAGLRQVVVDEGAKMWGEDVQLHRCTAAGLTSMLH